MHHLTYSYINCASDPHTETRVPLDQQIYVPCDERVGTAVIAAPSLKRINELPGEEIGEISPRKAYAARTLLFLNNDSTLRPLAIELSSPHQEDEQLGSVSTVYTPPDTSDDNILSANMFTAWDLAKAHATANDTSKNNFVIHWYAHCMHI